MPLLAHATSRKDDSCRGALMKSVPKSPSELAAAALSNLWTRLLKSYTHFSQPGCTPFVVEKDTPASGVAGTAASRTTLALEMPWPGCSSPTAACAALIEHLFLSNEPFDAVSWVIAFCLIDRLQLNHYVRQRLQNICLWRAPEHVPPAFLLVAEHTPQLLFTVYCLAFKWHLDYTVSLKYLTNLLPHSGPTRKAILRTTIAHELLVLQVLEYNCAVTADHVAQLMDHFLTAAERTAVLQAFHRKSKR